MKTEFPRCYGAATDDEDHAEIVGRFHVVGMHDYGEFDYCEACADSDRDAGLIVTEVEDA